MADYDLLIIGGGAAGLAAARAARWDDKTVALIGTGATAVQCVPHLATSCGTFYVCQRTPSSVDVRSNEKTDATWYAHSTSDSGWQQRWMENFTENMTPFGKVTEDLVYQSL